jgi:hypothetical protein
LSRGGVTTVEVVSLEVAAVVPLKIEAPVEIGLILDLVGDVSVFTRVLTWPAVLIKLAGTHIT